MEVDLGNSVIQWNSVIKWNNVHITEVPEEEWGKEVEGLFEQIIADNFPNLGKETGIQIQELERTPQKSIKLFNTSTFNSKTSKFQR